MKFFPFQRSASGRRGLFSLGSKAGALAIIVAVAVFGPTPLRAEEESKEKAPKSKFKDFNEVVKGAEEYKGLFNLYRTNDTLYAEIGAGQLNQPFIAPITIAKGMAMAGQPLNFGDEWILMFRRAGDKVQVLRRNIHYKGTPNTPIGKAVDQNYTDSVLMALPIVSVRGGSVLVDFSQLFFTDFANLRLGAVDRNRTTWHKIKAFPNNIELQVEATFARGNYFFGGADDGVADSRGLTLVIHYSLAKLPEPGYRPRHADYRVGHFLSAHKDFNSDNPDTVFVRYINRWRLEKADPKAKLSPPKKQLVWWVEDTVPHEYRPYVEDGILEWNKAFEKIGYRNAIGVRWQNEGDDFDPEDINYCTFRWITTSSTFAQSGIRANPLTGEIIDGDVIFDAGWIRYWKGHHAMLVGSSAQGEEQATPMAAAEIISPMMAIKKGYGLPFPLPGSVSSDELLGQGRKPALDLIPSEWTPLQAHLRRSLAGNHMNMCQCATAKHGELTLAAIAMTRGGDGEKGELPEEFLAQTIKEVVMHEVGHSLGLRHNFKASTMLSLDEINDPKITQEKGMSGSVMDYNPINIAGPGQKQGDYASVTIGPYDYWAIEYAYSQVEGDEMAELKKIASRSPSPELIYATDEDMYLSDDPAVNAWDLGSDPLAYGKQRMSLAKYLMDGLEDNIVKDGDSWARLRHAFTTLLGQVGNAAYLASSYVGGHSISRDFKGGENSHDPVSPIPGKRQREALEFLVREVLTVDNFKFEPSLLRKLSSENWYHWGSGLSYFRGSMDFPIYDRILSIQRIALDRAFDAEVLTRIQNQQLKAADPDPLTIAELFNSISDGVWSELSGAPSADEAAEAFQVATLRRNLQREHLQRLSSLVLGNRGGGLGSLFGYAAFVGGSGTAPADARSLARMHLIRLEKKIEGALSGRGEKLDETTRAHLDECKVQISKVLEASYTVN